MSTSAHVTVAYAALMHDAEMARLREELNDKVRRWKKLEPRLRPRRIMKLKQFPTQTPAEKGSYGCTKTEIAKLPLEYVKTLLAEKRIDSLDIDEPDELEEHVLRC